MQGDAEHRGQIFALAGIPAAREREADQDRDWRQQRAAERREARERQRLLATIRQKREKIIARHPY